MTHGELVQILLSTVWLDDTGRGRQAQYILERYDLVRRETSTGPNERPAVSPVPTFSNEPGAVPLSTQLRAALVTEEAREKSRIAETVEAERQGRAAPTVDPGRVLLPGETRETATGRVVDSAGNVLPPGDPRAFVPGPLPGAVGPLAPLPLQPDPRLDPEPAGRTFAQDAKAEAEAEAKAKAEAKAQPAFAPMAKPKK